MVFLENLINNLVITITLSGAAALVAYRMPKRKHFTLRVVLCVAVILGIAIGFSYFNAFIRTNVPFKFNAYGSTPIVWASGAKFTTLYIFLVGAVLICFDCNIWSAVFCSTAAYCLQHISQRFYSIFELLLWPTINSYLKYFAIFAVTSVFCAIFYFIFIWKKKYEYKNIMVDNKLQIFAAACVVTIASFVNTFAISAAYWSKPSVVYVYIFSIIACFLSLMLELSLLSSKTKENELTAIKRILHEEREQYLKEKENVKIINIKCHDLKHQIRSLENKISGAELKEIAAAVDIYDSAIKTGSEALDLILSQKSLYCRQKDIKLTCLINGSKLDFIAEHELYSLFGNALDNAIDSVEKLAADKRIISITETRYGELINIRIENYFEGKISFEDGLPETSKNKNYHGFGMKSMKLILSRHGGSLKTHTNGNIFVLDFFIPEKKKEDAVFAS